MASFMSYFTGRRDPKQSARDAIVSLREQLMMIEKKEEHLQRQIAQDLATAKANAVSNKNGMSSSPLLWVVVRTRFTRRGAERAQLLPPAVSLSLPLPLFVVDDGISFLFRGG